MKLQKFVPIIAECNQGQKLKGVSKGGLYLYNNIFKNITNEEPIFIKNDKFNSYDGYKELFNVCSSTLYPLILGGDHSIGTSTILGSVQKYKNNVTVLWIDAHADINTFEASLSKNRHGIPVACATKLDNTWFNKDIETQLAFEKLIYVGIRDLDKFEKDVLKKYNIKHFTVEQTINFINSTEDVIHVSFDVDALEPSILDSTGTMADEGMDVDEVKKIIDFIIQKDKLIGLDVVEFNPELRDVKKSLKTIEEIFLS
jgi:arginase